MWSAMSLGPQMIPDMEKVSSGGSRDAAGHGTHGSGENCEIQRHWVLPGLAKPTDDDNRSGTSVASLCLQPL
jgi:hypothetical protein